LGSHDGISLYTGGKRKKVESRKLRVTSRKEDRKRRQLRDAKGAEERREPQEEFTIMGEGKKKGTVANGCPTWDSINRDDQIQTSGDWS
jgi:hypothetical protein